MNNNTTSQLKYFVPSDTSKLQIEHCFDSVKDKIIFRDSNGEHKEIPDLKGQCFRELNAHNLCDGCPKKSERSS